MSKISEMLWQHEVREKETAEAALERANEVYLAGLTERNPSDERALEIVAAVKTKGKSASDFATDCRLVNEHRADVAEWERREEYKSEWRRLDSEFEAMKERHAAELEAARPGLAAADEKWRAAHQLLTGMDVRAKSAKHLFELRRQGDAPRFLGDAD